LAVPPARAVRVAVSVELTAATVAVNDALVAPAATVTEAGTVTAALLLVKPIVNPPAPAAALRVTVHASLAAPVIDPFAHARPLSAEPASVGDTPVPLRSITVGLFEELLAIVSCPLAAPAAVGSNCTVMLSLPPAGIVTGKLAWPVAEKNCPVTES